MTQFSGRILGSGRELRFEPLSGDWHEAGGGVWVAVHGHPRPTDGSGGEDAGTWIASAWRHHGDRLAEHVRGAFALAVVDTAQGTGFAAIDRLGQKQLYFARHGDGLGIGTTAGLALAAAEIERQLSSQDLFHYLYFHMIPSPGCIYEGVAKLPAAHALRWRNGIPGVAPYWVPTFHEPDSATPADLMDCLEQAVAREVPEGAVGAFLSGGLDSSTVAGLLARVRPDGADTFSIGFDAEGYDEMAYARRAVAHFGTRAHEYYVQPGDVVGMVPRIAAAYDEPFGNSSALPAFFCAKMAAESGITRLLAGDGGDELFAGNERYAKQGVFEHWGRIPAPLRCGVLEPIFTHLPSRPALLRKARSYVEQARVPLPDRLQTYNFMHRTDPNRMLTDDFLASLDLEAPLALQRAIYGRPAGASELNRMMYLDWQITLADNDLRKVTRMCELAGVEVAFPMLDDALVEYSLGVPTRLKLRHGRLRHFYKESVTGFLPAEIIDKKKHGFGLPFGVWMGEHAPLRELAYDSLGSLKNRGYLRPDFIDQAVSLHSGGHAGYYGELIWVLMMLELWMQAHGEGQG